MSETKNSTLAILGCGTMGKAFARALSPCFQIRLFDHTPAKALGLAREIEGTAGTSLEECLEGSEIVILAFKPKDFELSAPLIAAAVPAGTLVCSLLATISLAQLRRSFPKSPIVRIMPNLAAEYGQSTTALCCEKEGLAEVHRIAVETIATRLGNFSWLSEDLMPGFIALAGSGPAFHCVMIEAMVEAGISLGFKPEAALQLVLQSLQSSVALLESSKAHPAALKWSISTPGGTTIAGLLALEAHNLRHAIIQTILSAAAAAK